jgi:hypothetical protein
MRWWRGIGVVVALGGCQSTRTPPRVAPTSTTSRPAATTTTVAPPRLIPQVSPDAAANAVLSAWARGDIPTASLVATPTGLAQVFAHPPSSFSDRGCQVPIANQATCSFGITSGGLANVHTVVLANGWVVDQVIFE